MEEGELDVEADLLAVFDEPGGGDEPVAGDVVGPADDLGDVDEAEEAPGEDGHRWAAGEDPGVEAGGLRGCCGRRLVPLGEGGAEHREEG